MRALLFSLLFAGLLAAQTVPEPVTLSSLRAADFGVTSLDGAQARLNDLIPDGQPVVIEFWATWCSPCRKTMPHLSQLAQRHAGEGLVVVGLNLEDLATDGAKVKKYLTEHPVAYSIAFAQRDVYQFLNHRQDVALPKILVFDRNGRLVDHIKTYSFGTNGRVRKAVEAALRP